jgi:uncharacterized membrane protein YphA (DoxX/SURF4 family)
MLPQSLAVLVIQLAVTLFLAVLFLQSGFDKVFDWAGNKAYLTEHFKKSPLKSTVPLLLPVITALEVLAGACCAGGAVLLLLGQGTTVAFVGAALSSVALLSLFFGQRMAKDYGGAAGLVPYFLLSVAAMTLLTQLK